MIIYHHLGLGDHFMCYGLVRHFAEQETIQLLCKTHNLPTVQQMYSGHNIELIPVAGDQEANELLQNCSAIKRIGFTDTCNTGDFGKEFYRQAGIPYDTRWKYKINISPPKLIPGVKGKIIIHDKNEFTIHVAGTRIHHISGWTLLDWSYYVENAEKIYCIESSVRQMIEFLNPKGVLYLYSHSGPKNIASRHVWNTYANGSKRLFI